MSLQVLNPLPSPRCTPLLSPSNRFECRCSSTESAGSEHLGSTSESPSISRRQETTYFPTVVAISTTASATATPTANQSRRVRFRPPPTNTTNATATAPEDSSCEKEKNKVSVSQAAKRFFLLNFSDLWEFEARNEVAYWLILTLAEEVESDVNP